MSVTAAIRRLVAQGFSVEQALAAAEICEAEMTQTHEPIRTARQERNKRYYDSKKASEKHLNSDVQDVSDADSLSPKKETSPTPPKEKTTPNRETENAREFDEVFWPSYPLKRGKPNALKAFRSARKRASLDAILAGVCRYAAERAGEDPQYTKHAQGWLNDDGWTDEPAPPRPVRQAQAPPETVGSLSLKQLVNPRNDNDATDYPDRRVEVSGPGRLETGARAAQAFTIPSDIFGRI